MSTTFADFDLEVMSLAAPTTPVRSVRATYGHLWQWTGDGEDLFSLSVAVRGTRLGNPQGVRDHLHHELLQMRVAPLARSTTHSSLDDPQEAAGADRVDVWIEGATGAEAAEMTGVVAGNRVRERVVVATDGRLMHVVRVYVPDTVSGDGVLARVTGSLQLRSGDLPDRST